MLICPATGVPQRFYFRFAAWLAAQGHTVLVFDYRGIGQSNQYQPGDLRFEQKDRVLSSAVFYNFDYGFIEGTRADDGDHTDAMLLIDEPTFPGCRVWARPVGGLRMRDEKGIDDKIVAVSVRDPQFAEYTNKDQLPAHVLRQVRRFFEDYKGLEHKQVIVEDMLGPEEALDIIRDFEFAYLDAIDFGEHGRFTRLARFEQFHHARQTAGDVFGLSGFTGDFGQHVAGVDLFTVAHHQVGMGWHQVLLAVGARSRQPVGADFDRRLPLLVRRVGHHPLRHTGDFVDLLSDRRAFLDVFELHHARVLDEGERTHGGSLRGRRSACR